MAYRRLWSPRELNRWLRQIEGHIYTKVADLEMKAWITPEPLPFDERFSGREQVLTIGDKWGDLWDCAWFNFKGQVPSEAQGQKVVLLIDVNGEACVVDADGTPWQGLTNVNSGFDTSLGLPGKWVVPLSESADGGERIDLWADAACNDLFGNYRGEGRVREAHVAICHNTLRALYYDAEVLLELMQRLPEDSPRRAAIHYALDRAANSMSGFTEADAARAREILAPELSKKNGDPSLAISAIGHAHIDLAWLWPIRETIRKGARTFSTALRMLERYPDYVFGASQPQLYAWMKEYYPALYSQVKEQIAAGRWEAQGAMWVECDTNVSGAEALVRQLLYGKRFFRSEFGKDPQMLWLPDVFGYTGSLPQLLKKADVDYFMTIKLSWNTRNRFPHHTFVWEGIDGSQVLAHMPPEGTYNSSAAPRAIIKAEREYLEKGIADECLMLFGIGDGGGGPGEEHLERLQRERNLAGLAPVRQEPAEDFFERLAKKIDAYPVWSGELYLERHRGTYTSQARSKRYNRKLEIALRELELAGMRAAVFAGYDYPADEIGEIWREVLLYQFHDILPGSSITRVYDESLERYATMLDRVLELTDEAYAAMLGTDKDEATVVNTLSWARQEWVQVEGDWQQVEVPALGMTTVSSTAQPVDDLPVSATSEQLENEFLRVRFDADGSIGSILDKEHDREVIAAGEAANVLAVYVDVGDAWDIPVSYGSLAPERFELVSSVAEVDGPQAQVTQVYEYGQSRLTQQIVLLSGSRRLDFVTEVDWQERGKMLRTSFPVNVFAREATCDIQFGSIKRPTHRNTSWDEAKFEVCAHKWVDMSQGDYGVALLNDCKYGHQVIDNILDLNLLRSPSYPDPQADRAGHKFTYALYPHAGDHVTGGVVRQGYELNMPLSVLPGRGSEKSQTSFLCVEAPNVIVEAVKRAEDSDDIVVRLYECHGAGVTCPITFGFPAKAAWLTNLLEEPCEELPVVSNAVEVEFKPFEIQTVKIAVGN